MFKDISRYAEKFVRQVQLLKIAQETHQDIRVIPGANTQAFGPQSWVYINQLMNELNKDLNMLAGTQKAGNQEVNFQTVVKNPTIETRFSGAMKHLCQISAEIWKYVGNTSIDAPYSVEDAQGIIKSLNDKINTASFPEPDAQHIKPTLISILNNWKAILGG